MIVGASSSGASLFFLVVIALLVIWMLVVRPQKRRQLDQQRMQRDLQIGDEVLTVGGIYGTITRLDENEVSVEIAPSLVVRVARRAVAGIKTEEPEAPEEPAEPEEQAAEEPAEAPVGDGSTGENGG